MKTVLGRELWFVRDSDTDVTVGGHRAMGAETGDLDYVIG
jgi:hypothetical protein